MGAAVRVRHGGRRTLLVESEPALTTLLHAKPAEIRDFLAGTLAGDRTREFTEKLRVARVPV